TALPLPSMINVRSDVVLASTATKRALASDVVKGDSILPASAHDEQPDDLGDFESRLRSRPPLVYWPLCEHTQLPNAGGREKAPGRAPSPGVGRAPEGGRRSRRRGCTGRSFGERRVHLWKETPPGDRSQNSLFDQTA